MRKGIEMVVLCVIAAALLLGAIHGVYGGDDKDSKGKENGKH